MAISMFRHLVHGNGLHGGDGAKSWRSSLKSPSLEKREIFGHTRLARTRRPARDGAGIVAPRQQHHPPRSRGLADSVASHWQAGSRATRLLATSVSCAPAPAYPSRKCARAGLLLCTAVVIEPIFFHSMARGKPTGRRGPMGVASDLVRRSSFAPAFTTSSSP